MQEAVGTSEAALLGTVQGLTEFFPVSSSGHLVIAGYFLGLRESHLGFDLLLHIATLIAVVFFYRTSIGNILKACAQWATGRGGDQDSLRMAGFILLGSIPTGIIGLFGHDLVVGPMQSPRFVATMLLVTGILLFVVRGLGDQGREIRAMTWKDALLIGIVQGISVIPGISRSGSTIVAALGLGLHPRLAAQYSFLMSIPAVAGATFLEGFQAGYSGISMMSAVVGMLASGLCGLLALSFFVPLVVRGHLYHFSWYLFPVAVITLVLV